MTRYLIDTNVISATAPAAAVGRPALVEWMESRSRDLFLSAITIAEITDGIAKAKREGAKRKASDLSAWLRAVLHLYGHRVLPFDSPTAEIAGVLADLARGCISNLKIRIGSKQSSIRLSPELTSDTKETVVRFLFL